MISDRPKLVRGAFGAIFLASVLGVLWAPDFILFRLLFFVGGIGGLIFSVSQGGARKQAALPEGLTKAQLSKINGIGKWGVLNVFLIIFSVSGALVVGFSKERITVYYNALAVIFTVFIFISMILLLYLRRMYKSILNIQNRDV